MPISALAHFSFSLQIVNVVVNLQLLSFVQRPFIHDLSALNCIPVSKNLCVITIIVICKNPNLPSFAVIVWLRVICSKFPVLYSHKWISTVLLFWQKTTIWWLTVKQYVFFNVCALLLMLTLLAFKVNIGNIRASNLNSD